MKTYTLVGMMMLAAGPALAQTEAPPPNASAPNGPVSSAPASHSTAPKATMRRAAQPVSMEARVEQRITHMHQRLQITAEQQPAWDAFAQTMRDNAVSIDEAYKARRASVVTMSAPDNMQNFAQIEQARAGGIQKLAASFQTVYNGMSDDQKKIADAMFRNYGGSGPGGKKAAS